MNGLVGSQERKKMLKLYKGGCRLCRSSFKSKFPTFSDMNWARSRALDRTSNKAQIDYVSVRPSRTRGHRYRDPEPKPRPLGLHE